jgi:mannosyl-3-phosphoglycerate phosphatase
VVICSSKTKSEIEHYRKRLDNRDPFIIENGGAVFVPEGYFGFPAAAGLPRAARKGVKGAATGGGYEMVRLGAPYEALRSVLAALRAKGLPIKGFGDMTAAEVAAATGLPPDQAAMAKERAFDEPFYLEGDGGAQAVIARAARRAGLRVSGRGPFHLTGSDKGKAVLLVRVLFRKALGDTLFAALGDSSGDLPMLLAVDRPIVVQRADGTYDPELAQAGFPRANGPGPAGWNKAVLALLAGEAGPGA